MLISILNVVALAVMLLVAIVLLRGLWNTIRGGSSRVSNKYMQARVALQFIAVVIVLFAFWLSQ